MAEQKKSGGKKAMGTGHHPSALKRDRQNKKHRERNRAYLTQMRSKIKRLRISLDSKNKTEAEGLLKATLPFIAQMAGKGMIHSNTAARYTSRLTRQFNGLK